MMYFLLLLILVSFIRHFFNNTLNVSPKIIKRIFSHKWGKEIVHNPYILHLLLNCTLKFYPSPILKQHLSQKLHHFKKLIQESVVFNFCVVSFTNSSISQHMISDESLMKSNQTLFHKYDTSILLVSLSLVNKCLLNFKIFNAYLQIDIFCHH